MTRSELLHAAEVCVCGQREEDYTAHRRTASV